LKVKIYDIHNFYLFKSITRLFREGYHNYNVTCEQCVCIDHLRGGKRYRQWENINISYGYTKQEISHRDLNSDVHVFKFLGPYELWRFIKHSVKNSLVYGSSTTNRPLLIPWGKIYASFCIGLVYLRISINLYIGVLD